jgi:hypothetical protein
LEIETKKSEDKRLNTLVAITVLAVSVFLAVTKLKDDNIVHKMNFVKADSVDVWNEYQAERIKLHVDENALSTLALQTPKNAQVLQTERARLERAIAKYNVRSNQLAATAHATDGRYKTLEYRHEQFDIEDGVLSITLALTAVAALAETYWLLVAGWGFAAFGIFMGLAGLFEWGVHPETLARFLGA